MPRTAEDVENYLLQLERRFENDKGTFLIFGGEADPTVALRVAGPVVALRVDIGPVPAKETQQAKLFKRLLEFNATDVGSSRVDLQACKLEYSIVSPK